MPEPQIALLVDGLTGPGWTDLASRLHYGDGGGPLTVDVGRQTELQDVEPTRIAAVLKNGDSALTPNNAASPYAGTWEQGRRVRVVETVGGVDYTLGTGYLEIPDVQVNTVDVDQPCTISAVDLLGRLAGAAPFEGTLAEHVRTQSGGLVAHYPLTDSYPHMSTSTTSVLARTVTGFEQAAAADPEDLIRAADLAGPPGDDQSYTRWEPVSDGTTFVAWARLGAEVSIPVGATDTLAVSAWAQAQDDANGWTDWLGQLLVAYDSTAFTGGLIINDNSISGLHAQALSGGSSTTLSAARRLERGVWRLITARLNSSTGQVDLWSGSDLVASTTVTPPGAYTIDTIRIGPLWVGGIGHVQIRVGPDATTMPYADHLAQYAHGYRGLHRQTVAERIATLADFAGVDPALLDLPDTASTPMQTARLAGAGPAQAMRDAATTGQDTLMTNPDGQITLIPRGQRYGQAVAMQIPFGWLAVGGIRYRPDRPVTDTVATRTGGGTARRADTALRTQYGVQTRTVTLDTAVDEDPAAWAVWTLEAFGQSRTRCPVLRLDMLKRTTTERQALLSLRVGDRIELTGMPAGSPADVPHLIVQGIKHTIGPHRRRLIELNTSPLLGPAVGTPPVGAKVGTALVGSATIAY